MATPHRLVNGQAAWEGKTKTAAEAERDEHLNRLFSNTYWEPIVIPFPQGVMIGFLTWAGSWESFTHWHHQTPEQRRWHGCTIHNERDRKQVLIGLHRHVASLVRDSDGTAAGLEYLWHEDSDGKEDFLQMDAWQAAYKAARAEGKGDVEAREIADMARAAFANRTEREPVRSLEAALVFLETGNPVPVSKHVWHQCRKAETLKYEGRFLVCREQQVMWCNNPSPHEEVAWISSTLIAGYEDATEARYCLLRLQADDQVLPISELPLRTRDFAEA